jgi:hypothetical protein
MIPEARRKPRKIAGPVSRGIQQKPLPSGKFGRYKWGYQEMHCLDEVAV